MKKTMIQYGLVLLMVVGLSSASYAQNLDKIVTGVKTANAKELARYFDNSVDITILNVEDSYRKAQAEMVVRDFFMKNPPVSFAIKHQGSSNQGSKYAIGIYTSRNGEFRTYIHYNESGGSLVIHEIRFDRD